HCAVGTHPELTAPATALSLGGLRRRKCFADQRRTPSAPGQKPGQDALGGQGPREELTRPPWGWLCVMCCHLVMCNHPGYVEPSWLLATPRSRLAGARSTPRTVTSCGESPPSFSGKTLSEADVTKLGHILRSVLNSHGVRWLRKALKPTTPKEMEAIHKKALREEQALWLRDHPGKTAKDFRRLSYEEIAQWRKPW